ncbi:hypothetical protein ACIQF6_20015 [Kitasatospora sp. NPDC092948]|uniref:hypothetical protein n=1 Tax=Kitasatospora sp. NPDC092948 TaxID=3364088 RepID=UPI0037F4D4C7
MNRRERTGHRCSRCGRTFALDPKSEPGRLHDLKFMELVQKGTGGRLWITVDQLYWINERRLYGFPGSKERRSHLTTGIVAALVALALGVLALSVDKHVWVLPLAGSAVFATGRALKDFLAVRRIRDGAHLRPRLSPTRFEFQVINRWREVYHELPPGLVERPPIGAKPGLVKARAVVLCELPAVAAFLRINGFAERHQVLLVEELKQIPADLPVVVLRDLSLSALARTVAVRAALPGRRVVDGGLTPRSVFAPAKAVRLRDPGKPQVPAALAASTGWRRLTDRERDWLAAGQYSPLLTMPPPKLYALAEKAVQRAVTAPTPPATPPVETPERTRRRAERIGFLTWPQAVAGPTADPAQAPTADAPSADFEDGSR